MLIKCSVSSKAEGKNDLTSMGAPKTAKFCGIIAITPRPNLEDWILDTERTPCNMRLWGTQDWGMHFACGDIGLWKAVDARPKAASYSHLPALTRSRSKWQIVKVKEGYIRG